MLDIPGVTSPAKPGCKVARPGCKAARSAIVMAGVVAKRKRTAVLQPVVEVVCGVTVVEVLGGLEVRYAGFTETGCLALTHTGLVVELAGADCDETRDGLCEHQSCFTVEGEECLFPFQYKGRSIS